MKMKIIIVLVILGLGLLIFYNLPIKINQEVEQMDEERLYQGPVPEGYDEKYFRQTGITKQLEE